MVDRLSILHVLYVTGGESPTYQATRLCTTANVVVISASYRLAPENRLPIAFNDAYITMSWLQKQVNTLPYRIGCVFLRH